MLKTIIITAMLMLAGVTVAPSASAGTYCSILGSQPTLDTAEQAILQAVTNDDSEGIANDIIDNCPQNYDIIMEAGNNLLNRMGA